MSLVKGIRTVWMAITLDKYELPYAIGDTAEELAMIVGTTSNSIRSAVSHQQAGRRNQVSYCKVEWEENE